MIYRLLLLAVLTLSFHAIQGQRIQNLGVQQCDSLIKANASNPNFVILDVRTPGEYTPDHLVGAIQRNFYDADFEQQLDDLVKSKLYLIHCQSGSRSGNTLPIMKKLGFTEVYNMLGGMRAWKRNNYPTTGAFNPDSRWVSDSVYPLTSVPLGEVDTLTLTVTNRGNAPLVLHQLEPVPLPYTTDFAPDTSLMGAEDYTFHLYYRPTKANTDSLTALLLSNSGTLQLQVVYQGTVNTSTSAPTSEDFRLYPNPANNFLSISALPASAKHLFLTAADGKVLRVYPRNAMTPVLDISRLSPGYYFIRAGAQCRPFYKRR